MHASKLVFTDEYADDVFITDGGQLFLRNLDDQAAEARRVDESYVKARLAPKEPTAAERLRHVQLQQCQSDPSSSPSL